MELADAIANALGSEVSVKSARRVSSGSVNTCTRFDTSSGAIFVKHGAADSLTMFEAEADGLDELARANTVRTPKVLAVSTREQFSFLVLEWIDLCDDGWRSEAKLGQRLAVQHRVTQPEFGWHRDNTIGSTPQSNPPTECWLDFFRDQRLLPQLELAAHRGARAELIERGHQLCERLGDFFGNYQPAPSLLHGDLWGGNWGADANHEPVLFDPAVYYGDREADLAMTRLFGGFGIAFYEAYEAAWPLDAGAKARVPLYNLYHVLNHFNLFGGGYQRQALDTIQRLLATAR